MKKEIVCVDLFSGGGGLTEGFTREPFKIIAHVEKDRNACLTLKTRLSYHYLKKQKRLEKYYSYLKNEITRDELYSNIPSDILDSVLNYEISDSTYPKISKLINEKLGGKKVDLVFGGPPCQAYSIVGRGRDINGMKYDKRKYLYLEYIKFLKEFDPRFFVFENVKGLLSSRDEKNQLIIEKMITDFRKVGYVLKYDILNAKDFNIPQNRERVIIFGFKKGERFKFPSFRTEKLKYTVQELFSDLPEMTSGKTINEYKIKKSITGFRTGNEPLTQHISRPNNKRDLEIYKIAVQEFAKGKRLNYNDLPKRLKTHTNTTSFTDRFKVVSPEISHTIVAHIAKDGHYYIHPDVKQNRSLSVREAARLQSFPDNYYFEQSRTAAFKQIGNAVPPMMAKNISSEIFKLFSVDNENN